jgi:iron(III)-enterobactin esterase
MAWHRKSLGLPSSVTAHKRESAMMRSRYCPSLLYSAVFLASCSSTQPRDEGNGGVGAVGAGGGTPLPGAAGTSSAGVEGGGSATANPAGGRGGTVSVNPMAGASGSNSAAGASGAAEAGSPATDPGPQGDGDFTAGPEYELAADLTPKGNPQGRSFSFTLSSTASKIFTGLDQTLTEPKAFKRAVTVYVPAEFQQGTPAPLMVVQDGGGTPFVLIKAALDNLTIEMDPARRLPAFVAVAVGNGGGDGKGSQRGLEYDTMSDRYARFIDSEVLPAIENNPDIKTAYPGFAFTKDPEGRGAAGCSSGAAAAFTMAWFRPDSFRKVIAYSTTLVDQQDDDAPEEKAFPLGAWDYHSGLGLIESSELKPVRMFINVNETDNGYKEPESGHHNWLMANERTARALKSKGYHYRFVLGKGLGHCDQPVQRATMAEALLWLWRGYPNGL